MLFFQAFLLTLFLLPKSKIKTTFLILTLEFTIFAFFYFLQQISESRDTVYFFDRISSLGWATFPATAVYLLYLIANRKPRYFKWVILLVIIPLGVASVLRYNFEPESIKHYYFESGAWHVSVNPQTPWFFVFVFYIFISFIASFIIAIKWKRRASTNRERLKVNAVFISMMGFTFVSLFTNLVFPYFGNAFIPPIGHIAAIPLLAGLFFSLVSLRQPSFSSDVLARLISVHIREFVFYFDHQGHLFSVNRFCLDSLKYNHYELLRLPSEKFFGDVEAIDELMLKAKNRENAAGINTELITRSGQRIPVIFSVSRMDDYLGNFLGFVAVATYSRQKLKLQTEAAERSRNEKALTQLRQDLEILVEKRTLELLEANEKLRKEILEKKRAEQQIMADLDNKIELIREIHHRVKNNIQIIISLANMLAAHKDIDAEARDKLLKLAGKIRNISAIHEDLYASDNLSRINFSDLLKKLTSEIYTNKGMGKNIIFRLNVGNEFLGIDQAIPCAIIFDELVTNSLRHAFPLKDKMQTKGLQAGMIIVEFYRRGNQYFLIISDNGNGINKDIQSAEFASTGLGLVNILVNQHLNGQLTIKSSYGTTFTLSFFN